VGLFGRTMVVCILRVRVVVVAALGVGSVPGRLTRSWAWRGRTCSDGSPM